MPFWRRRKEEKHTFADLVRGLQHSVNSAMEMLEARNMELLSRYFTEDGNPRVRRLNINESTSVDIPIISIVTPSAMSIKEVEMNFDVQIHGVDVMEKEPQRGFIADEQIKPLDISMERSTLDISFNRTASSNTMNVRIKFKSTPVPEGVSRIIEEYDKTIIPFDRERRRRRRNPERHEEDKMAER